MKSSDMRLTACTRSAVDVGARTKTMCILWRFAARRISVAASGGRSVSSSESIPTEVASFANRSAPYRRIGLRYENAMSGTDLTRSAIHKTSLIFVPFFRARYDAAWITGPSAIGSENGTPSSIASAPARASASTTRTVVSRSGSPQVTYAIKPQRRLSRSRLNASPTRVMTGCHPDPERSEGEGPGGAGAATHAFSRRPTAQVPPLRFAQGRDDMLSCGSLLQLRHLRHVFVATP